MASILKVDDLRGNTTANDITVTVGASATMSLEQGLAKMWAHYDPRGSTFYSSVNTSAITDNGTGQHQITFSNNFSGSATHAFSALAGDVQSTNRHMPQAGLVRDGSAPFGTSYVEIQTNFDGQTTTLTDMDYVQVTGQGDLA